MTKKFFFSDFESTVRWLLFLKTLETRKTCGTRKKNNLYPYVLEFRKNFGKKNLKKKFYSNSLTNFKQKWSVANFS